MKRLKTGLLKSMLGALALATLLLLQGCNNTQAPAQPNVPPGQPSAPPAGVNPAMQGTQAAPSTR